jgi:hypothetical protein
MAVVAHPEPVQGLSRRRKFAFFPAPNFECLRRYLLVFYSQSMPGSIYLVVFLSSSSMGRVRRLAPARIQCLPTSLHTILISQSFPRQSCSEFVQKAYPVQSFKYLFPLSDCCMKDREIFPNSVVAWLLSQMQIGGLAPRSWSSQKWCSI